METTYEFLEDSFKSLRDKYRFSERENEDMYEALTQVKRHLKIKRKMSLALLYIDALIQNEEKIDTKAIKLISEALES